MMRLVALATLLLSALWAAATTSVTVDCDAGQSFPQRQTVNGPQIGISRSEDAHHIGRPFGSRQNSFISGEHPLAFPHQVNFHQEFRVHQDNGLEEIGLRQASLYL